jgi:predicted SAM-dependent methyltransferase
MWRNMLGEHLLLDLASGNPDEGELQPVGYILQDIEPHKGITLVCDLEELDKHIKPSQCKRIRISHALEHFPTAHVPILLKMFHTLLESDGNLEVHVPNFLWHAELLSEGRDEEAVTYAFGGQRDIYDQHKTAFTPKILRSRLQEAGFKIIWEEIEHSIHILAVKT